MANPGHHRPDMTISGQEPRLPPLPIPDFGNFPESRQNPASTPLQTRHPPAEDAQHRGNHSLHPQSHRAFISVKSSALALMKWIAAALVVAGILGSWEPGPELQGHSHPYAGSHEMEPFHSISSEDTRTPDRSTDTFPPRSDFHYHAIFDFASETCTSDSTDDIVLSSPADIRSVPLELLPPGSPHLEIEHPPLI